MSITRREVLDRANTLWPRGSVPYSQSAIEPRTGYRQDCSGFVSMCWGLPTPGLNTVTLAAVMTAIQPADLRPGDAVGICGPGTAGNAGHVVLFDQWYNTDPADDRYWLIEQAGDQSGPVRRVVTYPYDGPGAWKAYRYNSIDDGGAMANQDEIQRLAFNADAWGAGVFLAADEITVKTTGGPIKVKSGIKPLISKALDPERIADAIATRVVDELFRRAGVPER